MALYLAADYPRAREAFAKCADPGIFAYLADWRVGPIRRGRDPPSRRSGSGRRSGPPRDAGGHDRAGIWTPRND